MCVTTIHGGLNINSMPNSVTFTIDFRSIPSNSHEDFRKAIRTTLGGLFDRATEIKSRIMHVSKSWMLLVKII